MAKIANDDKIWRKVLEAKLNLQVMCDFSQRILNFLHESCSSSMVSTHEFYVVTTTPPSLKNLASFKQPRISELNIPTSAVPQLFESSQALKKDATWCLRMWNQPWVTLPTWIFQPRNGKIGVGNLSMELKLPRLWALQIDRFSKCVALYIIFACGKNSGMPCILLRNF